MGKPITGRSFAGCIRYVVDKQDAKILLAEGVRMQNSSVLIHDFNLQRKMRPELGKAVGHLVLSWSKEDLAKLSDQIMVERAKEYMEKVGIRDTQYFIVRHYDRAHPHLHLIYNRVDNNGMAITDKNNFVKNVKACKEITEKFGYKIGEGKERVNRQALRGKEKIRYELFDQIKHGLRTTTNWKDLEAELKTHGISIAYKFRSGTIEVQGISFEKGNVKMKGSAIDRSLSFGKINETLKMNQQLQQYQSARKVKKSLLEAVPKRVDAEQSRNHSNVKGLIQILVEPQFGSEAADPVGDAEKARKKRKKRQPEQSQSYGMSM